MNIVLIISLEGERQLKTACRQRSKISLLERYRISRERIIRALYQLIGSLADAAEQLRLTQQLHFYICRSRFVEGCFYRIHQVGNFHLEHIQQHEGSRFFDGLKCMEAFGQPRNSEQVLLRLPAVMIGADRLLELIVHINIHVALRGIRFCIQLDACASKGVFEGIAIFLGVLDIILVIPHSPAGTA
ncbi:hypothetical protein D3C75_756070 [compost metagenome]